MSNLFRPVSPASNSFLPEDYIARKTETRVNILILGLFALVLGGVVAAFVVTNRHWQELKVRKQAVDSEYAQQGAKMEQLSKLQEQRAQIMDKAEITAALVEHVPRWAVLGEITLRMPQSMRLDTLTIKSTRVDAPPPAPTGAAKQGTVVKSLMDKATGAAPAAAERPKVQAPKFTYALTIDGSATKNSDVADFLAALKNSCILDGLELAFIKEAKEKDRELRKFEISATVKTNADTTKLGESLQKLVADRTAQLGPKTDEGEVGPPAPSMTADGAGKAGD